MGLQNWRAVMEPSSTKNGTFLIYFEFAGVTLDPSIHTITLFLPDDPVITALSYFDINPKGYNQSPESVGSCQSYEFYYDKGKVSVFLNG